MSSKRYPEEFKIEAAKQVVDRGYSVAEVAIRLGTRLTACMHGSKDMALIQNNIRQGRMNNPRSGV